MLGEVKEGGKRNELIKRCCERQTSVEVSLVVADGFSSRRNLIATASFFPASSSSFSFFCLLLCSYNCGLVGYDTNDRLNNPSYKEPISKRSSFFISLFSPSVSHTQSFFIFFSYSLHSSQRFFFFFFFLFSTPSHFYP